MKPKFKILLLPSLTLILLLPTSVFITDIFADHKFRNQYSELKTDITKSSNYENQKKFYDVIELDVLNSTIPINNISDTSNNNYDFTHFKKFFEESQQPYYYLE
ncbi:MAG: hypothetical protein ACPKPY_03775 [Nitrososphaeraceae archaeon]